MPIETICNGCGQKLRVPDVHAGKKARCPACRRVYTVPNADPILHAADETQPWQPRHDTVNWRLRIPDGQVFGPVDKRELDQWMAEGRISVHCQVQSDASEHWMPAAQLYPELLGPARTSADPQPLRSAEPSVFDSNTFRTPENPYRSYSAPTPRRYLKAHRGVLVLTLGLLGFCCGIVGAIAWVLGHSDLREIREGRMDPSGRGITQAGYILGIISTVIWGLRILSNILPELARM